MAQARDCVKHRLNKRSVLESNVRVHVELFITFILIYLSEFVLHYNDIYN